MLVQFHPDTLEPFHLCYSCDDQTRAHYLALGNTVEHPDDMAHREVEIVLVDGKHAVRRRQPLTLIHSDFVRVGEEFTISGIPEGVAIFVNGSHMGMMDATQVLEFTAHIGGFYTFRFEGSGWITQEIKIEALP